MSDATRRPTADAEQIGDATDAADCVCIESVCHMDCANLEQRVFAD